MIQLRKKDYLQRIIEEFFSKIYDVINGKNLNRDEAMNQLQKCFDLFRSNFDIKITDQAKTIVSKMSDVSLLDQYAQLLVLKYQLLDIKEVDELETALNIINYIDVTDRSYSWNRSILKQDILRLLSTTN